MKFLGGLSIALILISQSAAVYGETVRIRLKRSVPSVQVSGFGLEISPSLSLTPKDFLLDIKSYKISILKNKLGSFFVIDDGKTKKRLAHSQLFLHGDLLRMDALPQKGDLRVYRTSKDTLDVVSEMPIETYLEGVLPAEMPSSWPLEAMKAQAVASRSYMLSLMKQRENQHYDLDASVVDQAFQAFGEDDAHMKRIKKIVKETKDLILVDSKDKVLRSFYHADCGGQTEEARYVWGDSPIRGTVKDKSCPLSPWSSWQVTLARPVLKEKLATFLKVPDSQKLKTVLIASRTPSGRVKNVDVVFSGGTHRISAQNLREVVGLSVVRSTQFESVWYGDEWRVKGRGYGHGVGLCQWGTRQMALDGQTFQKILQHYYPDASLKVSREGSVARKLPFKQQLPRAREL